MRTQGSGKKVSVDVQASRTVVDREHGSNDQSGEDGCANVDKNADGRVDIALYVPVLLLEM